MFQYISTHFEWQALEKMPSEIMSYLRWKKAEIPAALETELVQEKESDLEISDADSDVLFEEERRSLSMQEYQELKELALRSARDFERLYQAIPDKEKLSLIHIFISLPPFLSNAFSSGKLYILADKCLSLIHI